MPSPWEEGLSRREFLAGAVKAGGIVAGASMIPAVARAALVRSDTVTASMDLGVVLGGELQYFRMQSDHVERRLRACKEAGYNLIQTYVAWNVHEHTRGLVDFVGRTRPIIVSDHQDHWLDEDPVTQAKDGGPRAQLVANTDLRGFLEAATRYGFRVILRPGPFISDEWRNGGLPDWLLLEGYPSMFMRGPHGSVDEVGVPLGTPAGIATGGYAEFNYVGLSYASSRYLAEVARWLQAFGTFVRPWLASSGGPVVAVQVDDESCFYYKFGPFEVDYHPEMLARFRDISGEAPPRDWPRQGGPPRALRPAFSWQRFKADQVGVFLGTLASNVRRAGVDVPITHELELQLVPPGGLSEIARRVWLFPEVYTGTGPWSLPISDLSVATIRGAQRGARPVMSAEMDAGDPLLYPFLAGEGVSGGIGFDYTQGVPDAAIPEMARLGGTLRSSSPWLDPSRRRADTAIVWCPDVLYAPYGTQRYGFPHDARRIAERDVPALAELLVRAGYAFDIIDTSAAEPADYQRYDTIWLVGADLLPRRAQDDVVRYVGAGGRLVCWPFPPSLDEDLEPCATIAAALFPERRSMFLPRDGQSIRVLGHRATAWRGVQTFTLATDASPIAFAGNAVCGYRRPYGDGEAVLLGTFLAADAMAERGAEPFDVEEVPARLANAVARALAAKYFGTHVAASLPRIPLTHGGAPRYMIVYANVPQRRAGEFLTGGSLSYWDGDNVIGVVRANTDPTLPPIESPPYHPILAEHLVAARALMGRAPYADASDPRIQTRVLDSARSDVATVTVVNRYPDSHETVVHVALNGRTVRLPERGTIGLPASTGMFLPMGYPLENGVELAQATVQLLGSVWRSEALDVEVISPAGGEVVFTVGRSPRAVLVDGAPAAVTRGSGRVRLEVGPGERRIELEF